MTILVLGVLLACGIALAVPLERGKSFCAPRGKAARTRGGKP